MSRKTHEARARRLGARITSDFSSGTPPARAGVYAASATPAASGQWGYAYWDGERWGPTCANPDSALQWRAQSAPQGLAWCGLDTDLG